jgi:hypothetical protein
MNLYSVWVKGERLTTETQIHSGLKINALLKFASDRGLKTIDCDGKLITRNVNRGYKGR